MFEFKKKDTFSIAVVTNPLSVIIANHILFDQVKNTRNILIIDYGKTKKDFRIELSKCIEKRKWHKIIDLSTALPNNADLKPGFQKRMTRKYKHLPIIRAFYKKLQQKALKNIEKNIANKLDSELPSDVYTGTIDLFLLTQTYANNVLMKLFPGSSPNYFEHGIGDYAKVGELKNMNNLKFWGIFANEYKIYKHDLEINFNSVTFPQELNKTENKQTERDKVLILLQNLEIYNLDMRFWRSYFKDIVSNYDSGTTYLIKPHPLQSNEIMNFVLQFFNEGKFQVNVLPFAKGIELEFESIQEGLRAVYSPFSSSLYYLNKIYNSNGSIHFYQSIERVYSLINKAPHQYKIHFLENYKMVKEVFGKDCIEF
jgi:hypothetical protein